jgi:hypothetical protein
MRVEARSATPKTKNKQPQLSIQIPVQNPVTIHPPPPHQIELHESQVKDANVNAGANAGANILKTRQSGKRKSAEEKIKIYKNVLEGYGDDRPHSPISPSAQTQEEIAKEWERKAVQAEQNYLHLDENVMTTTGGLEFVLPTYDEWLRKSMNPDAMFYKLIDLPFNFYKYYTRSNKDEKEQVQGFIIILDYIYRRRKRKNREALLKANAAAKKKK